MLDHSNRPNYEIMGRNSVHIRQAAESDLAALTKIYNHYVRDSHVTFDDAPRSGEQAAKWMGTFGLEGKHRLFVAESEGEILGCAFSSEYRAHSAFRETVESGIYLRATECGRGVGTFNEYAVKNGMRISSIWMEKAMDGAW